MSTPMRRIRYQVACSLDGYIAGPNGEADWIITDPEIDFGAIFRQFDTLLMGRRTYEGMAQYGGAGFDGMSVIVFSRTLRQEDHPKVEIVAQDIEARLNELRSRPGKDIWLFGGGELFRSLLQLGCVDAVEPAVIPVLLGGGIPFLPTPADRQPLSLTRHKIYGSGIVLLEYAVRRPVAKQKKVRAKKRSSSTDA
jgi:dihydrofolate reductase